MSTQETKLKAIADAIREKEGSTDPIPANDFPARILALETGGAPEGTCTITLTASDPEGGTVTGGGLVSQGMTVTIKATPEDGYQFSAWKDTGKSILSDGYTELDYIQTVGGTSILTDVSVTTNTTRVVCDIEPTEKVTSYSAYILAAYNGYIGGIDLCLHTTSSNSVGWEAGAIYTTGVNSGTLTYNLAQNTRITIDMDTPNNTIKMGTSSFDITTVSCTDTDTKMRFGWAPMLGTAVAGLCMKIYSAQIYVDGELKGDFVPCKDSSGTAGLYNLVTGEFCVNNSFASPSAPSAGPESGDKSVVVSENESYTFTVTGDWELTAVFEEVPASKLPAGYTEVEYIQSNGTQYIDTQYIQSAKLRVTMDVEPLSFTTTDSTFFGCFYRTGASASTYKFWRFLISNNTNSASSSYMTSAFYNQTQFRFTRDVSYTRKKVELDGKNKTATYGEQTIDISSAADYTYNQNIYLFAASRNLSTAIANMLTAKLYSCQMADDDILVRDFVPCINPSGVVGLYDLVEGKFYQNSGTGTFTAGPAV